MFGRMTATSIVRLGAVKNLEVAVAELLAATERPPIARSNEFRTAVHLAAASRQSVRALPPSCLKAGRPTPLIDLFATPALRVVAQEVEDVILKTMDEAAR